MTVALLPWLRIFLTILLIAVLLHPMSDLGVECTEDVLVCSLISPLMFYLGLRLVSEVGAAAVLWICALALAVLLGYCIRLHASSEIDIIYMDIV
jgi:hypothetical protein